MKALTAATALIPASAALAATPKRGGKLIAAGDQHGPKDTLDPILVTAAIDYFRQRMFYNKLVRLKDDLSWEPDVASEVIPNADATTWTFKIRKDIEFHNGKTLDADDVIYTLERHLGKDSKSNGRALVAMINKIHKVNSHEIMLHLDSPNADLPMALGTFHFSVLQNGVDKFDIDEILRNCSYSESFILSANDLQILQAISQCYEEFKLLNRK